jgi:hypothetical protein
VSPDSRTDRGGRDAWDDLLDLLGTDRFRTLEAVQSDDVLIRNRACDALHRALTALRTLEAKCRQAFLPPPTRTAPDPDPARLAQVRAIRSASERIAAAELQVRGAAIPPRDRVWDRHRGQGDTLTQLVECDVSLVRAAEALAAAAAAVPPPPSDPGLAGLDAPLGELLEAMAERRRVLDLWVTEMRPAV